MEIMRRLVQEEEGQGMVEYALIIGLISVAAIVTMTALGTKISDVFSGITGKLKTPTN